MQIEKGPVTTVYEVMHRETAEHYAAKVIYRRYLDPSADAAVHAEVDILEQLHNSSRCSSLFTLKLSYEPKNGIIALKKFYIEPNRFVQILDYVPGGDLLSETLQRKRIPEEEVKHLAFYFLHTLTFLHDHNIVHRDIKPQNLLMKYNESGHVQLCIADFGLATKLSSAVSVDDFGRRPDMLREKCGTPAYVAPEVLDGSGYDESVDIWAFGAVLFYLLSGTPPFADKKDLTEDTMASYNSLTWDGGYHHFGTCSNSYATFGSATQNRRSLFSKIIRGDYNFCEKDWIGVSEEAKHLVGGLLTVDSTRRLTAEEALQHEWFANIRAIGKLGEEVEVNNETEHNAQNKSLRARTLSDGTVKSSNQRVREHRHAFHLKKKNLPGSEYSLDSGRSSPRRRRKSRWIPKKAKRALFSILKLANNSCDDTHLHSDAQVHSNSAKSVQDSQIVGRANGSVEGSYNSVMGLRGDATTSITGNTTP